MHAFISASIMPVLEMAVFCSTRVHVAGCSNRGKRFYFTSVILEYTEERIVAEMDAAFTSGIIGIYQSIHESTVAICIPAVDRVIEITAEIYDVSAEPDNRIRLIFNKLRINEYKDRRACQRISISSGEKLLQTFICFGSSHHQRKHPAILLDISESAAAIIIKNSALPIIESGKPGKFVIKKSGRIIFRGEIETIKLDSNSITSDTAQRHVVFFRHDSPRGTRIERRIQRIAPVQDPPVFIEAIHPLMPEARITGQLDDFSKLGFSFQWHNSAVPLFPGLILHHLKILIPHIAPIKATVRIVHCTKNPPPDDSTVHIGVEIIRFSDAMNIYANIFYQRELDPTLVDAQPEDFEKIINHLFMSNFIYPEKRILLQEQAKEILATQYRLLHANTISKTLISKKNNVVNGFIQFLKYHNHAWLIQHLVGGSRCSPAAGKLSVLATTEFFLNKEVNRRLQIEYIFSYFRPNNPFPVILFHGFAQKIADAAISKTYDYDYCTADQPFVKCSTSTAFRCTIATDDELHMLEECIDSQFGISFKKAEGLGRNELKNTRLSKEYRRNLLMRERQVRLVKNVDGIPLAFTVAEFCSPGANLSELTNSFKIYSVDNGGTTCPEEALDLIASVTQEEYLKRGITGMVLLKFPGAYLPKPFVVKKQYKFWYLNTFHLADFKTYFEEVTSNLKTYLRRFRATENQRQDNNAIN